MAVLNMRIMASEGKPELWEPLHSSAPSPIAFINPFVSDIPL